MIGTLVAVLIIIAIVVIFYYVYERNEIEGDGWTFVVDGRTWKNVTIDSKLTAHLDDAAIIFDEAGYVRTRVDGKDSEKRHWWLVTRGDFQFIISVKGGMLVAWRRPGVASAHMIGKWKTVENGWTLKVGGFGFDEPLVGASLLGSSEIPFIPLPGGREMISFGFYGAAVSILKIPQGEVFGLISLLKLNDDGTMSLTLRDLSGKRKDHVFTFAR